MARVTVKVKISGRRGIRKVSLPARTKVSDLLDKLGYSPQIAVTRRNGEIVVEEERLTSGDLIEIIPVTGD